MILIVRMIVTKTMRMIKNKQHSLQQVFCLSVMDRQASETVLLATALGNIVLRLRGDVAPTTAAHFKRLVQDKLLDNCNFYRSDFVIQFGLHGLKTKNPHASIAVNESVGSGTANALSNVRGAVAVAHWEPPDNGNSEFFIVLKDSTHLDDAWGGYCVFAQVDTNDKESWTTIDAIAAVIAQKKQPTVQVKTCTLRRNETIRSQ